MKVYRNQAGEYGVLNPDGSIRPLAPEELGGAEPTNVLDEMGVTTPERLILKNFARNPAMAAQFLRSRGHEVARYGSGLNFAVRRGPSEPWKIVDPDKGGLGEFFLDLGDILTDTFAIGATVAGTVAGGGLASAATGAATAGGAELLRQGLGEALGIEGNFAPLSAETQIQAALGGLAPGVGRVVGAVGGKAARAVGRALTGGTRLAGEAVETVAGRVAGIRPQVGLGVFDSLQARAAARTAGGRFSQLTHPEEGVAVARRYMEEVASPGPESLLSRLTTQRNAIVEEAVQRKVGIDLSPHQQQIRELAGELQPRTLNFSPEASFLREQISSLLNPPTLAQMRILTGGVDEAAARRALGIATKAYERSFSNIDPRVAVRIKDILQDWSAQHKFFVEVAEAGARPSGITKEFVNTTGRLSGAVNEAVRKKLPALYSALNDSLSAKKEALTAFRSKLGIGKESAESFVSNVFKAGKSDARAFVQAFDQEFGTNFMGLFRESALGLQFTSATEAGARFGVPSLVPRLGATGQIVQVGVPLAGAGIGGLAQGREGAGVGGAIGLGATVAGTVLASPRAMVAIAPQVAALGRTLIGGGQRTLAAAPIIKSATTRAANVGTLVAAAAASRTGGSKQVARQDAPRKLRFTGQ